MIEELVAELGAAFFCADLRIANGPRTDHAQYLASWLSVLKADNRCFTAASKASEAVCFSRLFRPREQPCFWTFWEAATRCIAAILGVRRRSRHVHTAKCRGDVAF